MQKFFCLIFRTGLGLKNFDIYRKIRVVFLNFDFSNEFEKKIWPFLTIHHPASKAPTQSVRFPSKNMYLYEKFILKNRQNPDFLALISFNIFRKLVFLRFPLFPVVVHHVCACGAGDTVMVLEQAQRSPGPHQGIEQGVHVKCSRSFWKILIFSTDQKYRFKILEKTKEFHSSTPQSFMPKKCEISQKVTKKLVSYVFCAFFCVCWLLFINKMRAKKIDLIFDRKFSLSRIQTLGSAGGPSYRGRWKIFENFVLFQKIFSFRNLGRKNLGRS